MDSLTPYDREDGKFIAELEPELKPWIWASRKEPQSLYAVPHAGNIGMFVYRKGAEKFADTVIDGVPIFTWERIHAACKTTQRPFLLEMKTVDTLCVFFLELCWSFGGGWHTERVKGKSAEGLRIKYRHPDGKKAVVKSLTTLQNWIHVDKIVAAHGTIDPRHSSFKSDWLFARHWYSTLVDLLTCKSAKANSVRHRDIGVAPIPVPRDRLAEVLSGGEFHSAWGEWYLGVWKGTENVSLGHELMNTFISSASTMTMARTGAGLPLIEEFYSEFSNSRCYGADLTYGQIRKLMFRGAFSRGQFNRYRFVMQRLFAGLTELITSPNAEPKVIWEKVSARINNSHFSIVP